jgi:hypothetical protein
MQTNHQTDNLRIKITANDRGNPPGKLADVELHFSGESPLAGRPGHGPPFARPFKEATAHD